MSGLKRTAGAAPSLLWRCICSHGLRLVIELIDSSKICRCSRFRAMSQDPAGASASVAIAAHLGRSRSAQCYLFNEADYTAAQRVGVEPLERFDEPEPIVACNELGDVIRR